MKSFTIAIIAVLAMTATAQNSWALWNGAITWNATTGCPTNAGTCTQIGGNSATSSCSGAFYFGMQAGTCSPLGTGCAVGTSLTVCTVCLQGYYLASGACTACGTGCAACTSATVCTACVSTGAYMLSTAGACVSNTGLKFQNLKAGTLGATAIPAATGCTLADANNMGVCLSAPAGTATQGYDATQTTTGLLTVTAVAGCLAYSVGAAGCVQCLNGYVPTFGTATSFGACTAVATATNAIANCVLYGYSTGATAVQCATCSAGYVPSAAGAQCNACITVNASCVTVPTSTGYAWSTPGAAWVSCATVSTNANACWFSTAGGYQTLGCATGFYLSAAGTCTAGTALTGNCAVGSPNGCLACAPQYFLSGASNCTACPGNCSTCTNASNCGGCLNNITLANGTCPNKGSVVFSGLAFLSAILYYFI